MNYFVALLFLVSINSYAHQGKNKSPVIDSYITVLDSEHLTSVRVNIENSDDPDGKIVRTEINFGDGFVSTKKDVIHRYAEDGVYNITIRAWDNKNAMSQYTRSIDVASNLVFTDEIPIYGPKVIHDNRKTNFSFSNYSADKKYKLVLTKQKTGWISAYYEKSLDWFEHRFKTEKNHEDKFEINVELNGVDIFAKNEIAKNTERAEKFVNLKPENKLKFDVEHARRNKYILEIKEVSFVKDIQAPAISMAIQSEAITNNSELPVTISDISGEITTYVWKVMPQAQLAPVTAGTVNQLIITTTQSSFNIPLTEGINYFIIQSVDRFNNKSEFVYLNNILLDTVAPLPVLISPAALASDYTYQFPYGKNIYVRFSEKVQSVSVNGIVATIDSIGQSASVLVPIANAGENSFQIVASDLAGNTTQFVHKFNVVHVTAPPVLNITYPISFVTKENKINLPFSVQSQVPTKTIIFLNGVEVFSTNASGSSPDLNLPVEGENHIELSVYYAVDGFDTSLKTSGAFTIERDTIAPQIASSSPGNGSIIYTNHLPLAIPLNILFSEYLTYISINNVFNQPTFYNSYATNYYATSAGVQQMQIQATDRAGNIANLVHSVNVDFSDVAPVLDFNANVKNLLTNKISVPVSGTSDKFLGSASLNGAAMQISSDGKSFFGVFDAPKNGRYKLEVTGTDRYGNIGSTSTYIRVLTSLPDQVLPATPPKLSYDFTTRTYVPQFGPAFQPQPSDDLCAALDNVFSQEAEFKDNLANLENNLQDVNDATGMTLKVPFEQDLKNFMGDVDEALNYIKAPYLMMCKGINILPKTDCPTNRSIFKLVMGSYPEPMIIKALPIPVSVQNFLIPRTNICTGFDSSGLNCQDMIAILPLIADLVLPGTGQLMASPAGQAISEALLCKELCDVPAVAETPVCKEYKLPDIPQISPMPTGIALPQRFGGGGSFGGGGDWGGGGGWPGGGGSCGGWFEPSCPGGGGGGSANFACSAYPSLFFCGNNGEYSRDHITIDTGIDCASLESGTLSSIIDLSLSRGLPLTVAYSSYIAQCLKSPVPGYPKTSKPVLTVTAPVQNQEVTDTVQVAGYVDDVYAQVQVNGQLVATVPSIFGASFNVMIPVPVDAVIRVEAADMFGNRAAPVEVVLSLPTPPARVINNDIFSPPFVVINGELYDWSLNSKLQPVVGFASGVTAVSSGDNFTCSIVNMRVKCWGNNVFRQVGLPRTTASFVDISNPNEVALGEDVAQISTGRYHTCALLVSGKVKCWGMLSGGLGNGTSTTSSSTPVQISGLESGVRSIGAGLDHSCAALQTGEVRCWGNNIFGQLGSGTNLPTLTPVAVLGLNMSGNITLAGGESFMCASTSKAIRCWGAQGATIGLLGNGVDTGSLVPVDAMNFTTNIIEGSLTVGVQHSCAGDNLGIRCWGLGSSGQLGSSISGNVNSGNHSSYPLVVDVIDTNRVTAFWAGPGQTCALIDNDVYCWGQGYGGSAIKITR